jgi:hypothetical protein
MAAAVWCLMSCRRSTRKPREQSFAPARVGSWLSCSLSALSPLLIVDDGGTMTVGVGSDWRRRFPLFLSPQRQLLSVSMAASGAVLCRDWVGQSQPRPGAERQRYDPQQPFTLRWLPCGVQRALDQIASMPATAIPESRVCPLRHARTEWLHVRAQTTALFDLPRTAPCPRVAPHSVHGKCP